MTSLTSGLGLGPSAVATEGRSAREEGDLPLEPCLEVFGGYGRAEKETLHGVAALTPQEAAVYALLAEAPLHIDDIIVKSTLTVGDVSAILLRLELKGAIMQLPGKHFAIA